MGIYIPYKKAKKTEADNYFFSEGSINSFGYELLQVDKIKDAIEIFKLNVEEYPESGNAFDSLGEAYMVDGDTKLAIENYEKSIEIDPENTNGIEMLKKLKKQ